MPDLSALVGSINWGSIIANTMYWLGYGLLGLFIILFFVAVFVYTGYNIKVDVFSLYGSGKEDAFSLSKPKKNRFKKIKKGTYWKSLYPLFNSKEMEPFDSKYIYPGNKVYAFKLNDELIPGEIKINYSGDQLRAELNPVPHSVRNWQSLMHRKNNFEFAQHNFWEDNKALIITLAAVVVCCALGGFTVYLTYKFAGGGTTAINSLASAINNMNVIGGVPPG